MSKQDQSVFRLLSRDVEKASEHELSELVRHLQKQMADTYDYWVGHWNNGNRAVSTRNGRYVANHGVIDYLK